MNSVQIRAWGCALLMGLTTIGCSADKEPVESSGGSTSTSTNVGGKSGVGGTSASNAGSSAKTTGGASTSAGGSSAVTGGAPNTGVGGTSAPANTATGGGVAVTGGAPNVGGASSTVPVTYTISGTVTGLVGKGLTLALGNGSALAISADGAFAFPDKLASGASAQVTVFTQPTGPQQTCTVSAAGTIASITSNVTNVAVTCATNTYKIGGTVAGLTSGGLKLKNNGGDEIAVSVDGSFVFPTQIASGQTFTVSISNQPTTPVVQTCAVVAGSGTVASGDVTSVLINCSTDTFSIGGTVTGLTGKGLVLRNNGGNDLSISAAGNFSFSQAVPSGGAYMVTVKTQPNDPSQTCTVTTGTGVVAAGNVTSVAVNCTVNKYQVKGTVTGLLGTGLTLQNKATDDLVVSGSTFTFATALDSGTDYSVTVLNKPTSPSQTCSVVNGTGVIGSADVTGVVVVCTTDSYSVGGAVVGLQNSGLVLSNGNETLTVNASDTTFKFLSQVASGANYAVKIKTQPANQVCSVVGGYGTVGSADVSTVTINCSDQAHAVSGTVTGLEGTVVMLSLNGNTPIAVTSTSFAFPDVVAKDSAYAVTVTDQPHFPWQTCTVTNGSGTMGTTDVTDVAITCTTNSYTIGGTVTGLAGSGLVLTNTVGTDTEDLPVAITADNKFVFTTPVLSKKGYAVTVKTQPTNPVQNCVVTNGSGAVTGANITDIQVACTTATFAISGNLQGLKGSLVLANGTDTLSLSANGDFSFTNKVPSGGTYNVQLQSHSADFAQDCTVTNGTGSVVDAAITNVSVVCVTKQFNVGVHVTGLANSNSLTLQNKAANDLAITADGDYVFSTKVESGQDYDVTVSVGPSNQTCTVTGGTGTILDSDATVTVNCSYNYRTVGGTISGLTGTGLVLHNSVTNEDLTVSAGADSFAFTTQAIDGDTYDVTAKTQPATPSQTCVVTAGSGTVSGNVNTISVACTTNSFALKVTVVGLTGTGLALNNGSDTLNNITADDTYTFPTAVLSGASYDVTVLTQPTGQVCTVGSPTGTMGNADKTLGVVCVNATYHVGGAVTGSVGTGGVTLQFGSQTLNVAAAGSFQFPTAVASGTAYTVTVATNPTNQTCTVTNGTGTVGNADVTNISVSCAITYNFDTGTMSASFWSEPTGSTITYSATEGDPTPGAIVAMLNYATGTAATCPSGTSIQLLGNLNLTGYTTFSAWVKVTDEWPTGDRSGGVQLFINGSSTYTSGAFTSWWDLTLGQWKQLVWTIPTGTNLSSITSWGVGTYVGSPAVCQPMTIEVDSMTFQ